MFFIIFRSTFIASFNVFILVCLEFNFEYSFFVLSDNMALNIVDTLLFIYLYFLFFLDKATHYFSSCSLIFSIIYFVSLAINSAHYSLCPMARSESIATLSAVLAEDPRPIWATCNYFTVSS